MTMYVGNNNKKEKSNKYQMNEFAARFVRPSPRNRDSPRNS